MSLDTPDTLDAASPELATQWYLCDCQLGPVRVGVQVGEERLSTHTGPLKIMRQAALLGEVELTLQAIELWQEIDLDLQPLDETSPAFSAGSTEQYVELYIAHKDMAGYLPVRFQFPANALGHLKQLNEELTRSLVLAWSTIAVTVVVAEITLPHAEYQSLEPGALLLLPASFESEWRARLLVDSVPGLALEGLLQTDPAQFVGSGPFGHSPPDSPAALSVRLQQRITLPAGALLSATQESPMTLELHNAPLLADLLQGDNLVASGSLGPVGAGHALFIQQTNTVKDTA